MDIAIDPFDANVYFVASKQVKNETSEILVYLCISFSNFIYLYFLFDEKKKQTGQRDLENRRDRHAQRSRDNFRGLSQARSWLRRRCWLERTLQRSDKSRLLHRRHVLVRV